MPVRNIPKNYRSVTGRFFSLKNKRAVSFESTLERDFFLSLEFDDSVENYEEQPLTITYESQGTKYTPDCLAQCVDGSKILYEIKYTTDLEKDAEELAPRFKLAERYVGEHGMAFRIVTELNIRGPKLENQRFIYGFSDPPGNTAYLQQLILDHLAAPLPLKSLLERLSADRLRQAAYTPVIWHLVFSGILKVDVNIPISNKSIIQVNHGPNIA